MIRVLLDVIVVTLELLLGFLPSLREAIIRQSTTRPEGILYVVTVQITVLIFYLAVRNILERSVTEQAMASLSAASGDLRSLLQARSMVAVLHEDEFYRQFTTALESAGKAVAICHLDTRPPVRAQGTAEAEYYRRFHELVVTHSGVRFQRIERVSREKLPWVSELLEKHSGHQNFSLGCLELGSGDRKTPYVSVQIVDDSSTFLVAIAQHYSPHTVRDILIRDADATALWQRYYGDLWDGALVLLENGVINTKNWKGLRQRLGG